MSAEHHRVSPVGKLSGEVSSAYAAIGRARLKDIPLGEVPSIRSEMCATCAFRPGTVPNGCFQTQMDLLKCVAEGVKFLCHAPKDGRMCAGFIQARAAYVAEPFPAVLADGLAKWEYSKDDDDPSEGSRSNA